ncbi:NAD(P) transhydrogenase subunit alpha [Rheinheimera sp. UJ51]|uniref:NAD(P) transhydrogenase subunit alpha n=1 Tax=unclassified Rheinheimera TaxID=115860 RepID=UPI001E3C9B82|nr:MULTISPECIES: NAD(P) transhydrogenase subunit alpha [unclassified Rheinheimera]MCC5453277.1 NAD(P) transhydrogenase subunit alpha [Rheinheimera sp. UJ51]MCF4010949.1 NAD(P) transhydrogenase subunit alpha [Rheinheimera sp. UJ63]
MATIAFLKETLSGEKRCALLPENVQSYTRLGVQVVFEKGLGAGLYISDECYVEAGAKVAENRESISKVADIILSIHPVELIEVPLFTGKVLISFLDPFNNSNYVKALREHSVSSISMEMVPRTTRCQKMDALSSQASLAGYVMVSKAMASLNRIFPMMMTAAGTIKPAKVFIVGAGVAGLQAIATAKRLGANVIAFDTRDVVAEQVESLGAKFLKIDLGDTGQTDQGYARALTAEQLAIQQQAQEKCIIDSDIVITTAQLFGRKPPKLISAETVKKMKSGSVIVDMAAENGGNVEGSQAGKTIELHGVTLIGTGNWPNEVPYNASQMYANNLFNLVSEFWDKKSSTFMIDQTDEILSIALITHNKNFVNPIIADLYKSPVQEASQ